MTDSTDTETPAEDQAKGAAAPGGGTQDPSEEVHLVLQRLEAEVDQRGALLRLLRPLAKPESYSDLKKLEGRIGKLRSSIDSEQVEFFGLGGLIGALSTVQQTAGKRRRKELGRELKAACQAAGLELRVVSQEEPIEVRITPLAVVLDFERGLAQIRFARLPLAECGATVIDILDSHRKALASLEGAFEPERFFEDCLVAYRMSLAALGRKRGDRVELNDFLATLALRRQSKKFLEDPSSGNYRGYGRAQFAYDVLRLRKAGGLTQGNRRINFGVATGTTASKKSRVIYMENGTGDGEYKLTVYFTEVSP